MEKTLLNTEEFKSWASKNAVLPSLDFPGKDVNRFSEDQQNHNKDLMGKYNPKKWFPTILILDRNGIEMGRLNVSPDSLDGYLESLNAIINNKID